MEDTTVKVKQVKHAIHLSPQHIGGSSCGEMIKILHEILVEERMLYDT